MTPLASVAMLEKLALLKIARCRAPALGSVSSACWRAVLPSGTPIRILVSSFPLVIVLPPVTCTRRIERAALKLHCEQFFNRVLELILRVRLTKEVCAFNKQSFHFVGYGIAGRVEHTQFRPQRDGLVRKIATAEDRCFEIDIGK